MRSNQANQDSPGILINNLGTPDSCEVRDIRKFLREFLWDPRVVKMPRVVWWLILNLIILNTRPKRSAAAYKKIWSPKGSPLLVISRQQVDKIRQSLDVAGADMPVALGMRYGTPSISDGIKKLQDAGANRFLVLPLYPQFSYTTTASVEDEVARVCDNLGQSDFRVVRNYYDNPQYIAALANSVKSWWAEHGKAEKLLMSFHGIPREYSDDGDPYQGECIRTAEMLAQLLQLAPDQWQLGFQSRLGPKKWLEPYTDTTLRQFARDGIRSVQVVCPGFAADCLETLEEIAMVNRETFIQAGGKDYSYIPCLNDSKDHIDMITNQILQNI